MTKRTSLKDIAVKVGVSTALVSYVLNGKEKEARVGEAMSQKIKAVAKELNYQPNLIAKGLKSGHTKTLGLIVADISNPFFSTLARIIEIEAKKNDYTVLFGSSDEDLENSQNLINTFLNRQVDGLIITPVEDSEKQIEDLQLRGIPFVLMDRGLKKNNTSKVIIDNYDAAFNATNLLIKNGYRKIAMIAYDTKLTHMQDRVEGYKGALKANKIKSPDALLIKVKFNKMQQEIEFALRNLIKSGKIDALVFATNSISIQALKVIHQLKIKVPQELGIISFDESEVFDFFYSPVTYIKQDMQAIGENAVKVVLQNIDDNKKNNIEIVVPTTIIVRESSGK